MIEKVGIITSQYTNHLLSKGLIADFKTNGFIIDPVTFFNAFNPKLFVTYDEFTTNVVKPLFKEISLSYDINLVNQTVNLLDIMNNTIPAINSISKMSLNCLKVDDEFFKFLVDTYPNYVELIDE